VHWMTVAARCIRFDPRRRRDAGIWEVREDPRQYVHSKVWALIALDRAARSGRALRMARQKVATWESTRDEIAEVRERGFSAELGSYVRSYGSSHSTARFCCYR